jgi:hypothetical protein
MRRARIEKAIANSSDAAVSRTTDVRRIDSAKLIEPREEGSGVWPRWATLT